jgi:hypothetical protein
MNFKKPKIRCFPAFKNNEDPDPAFKTNAGPCGSGSTTLAVRMTVVLLWRQQLLLVVTKHEMGDVVGAVEAVVSS